jgi:hypothetical protein
MRGALLAVVVLAGLAPARPAGAQDIDLICNPLAGDADSIRRTGLQIHIHLGDTPQMIFWDGTQPDNVSARAYDIDFQWWATKRADGQYRHGGIRRTTGKTVVWEYDHFEVAECLPAERLF